MGFEILPIEPGKINTVDPIYDVFEITGAQKWVPAQFRTSEEALMLNTTKTQAFSEGIMHLKNRVTKYKRSRGTCTSRTNF